MSLFRVISARLYAVVIAAQLSMMHLRERAILGLCALSAFLLPGTASAAGDLSEMIESAAGGAKSAKTSALEIFQLIGLFIFGGSVLGFKKVGTNPQVTVGRCVAGIAIGALLIVIPEIMSRTQKQLGTSSVTIS